MHSALIGECRSYRHALAMGT